MQKKQKIANLISEGLKDFSPVVLEYGKDYVVGFPNDINNNDLVLYVNDTEIVMTFGYQNAHFALDDINSAVIHSEKYLKSEYASVEFFQKAKDLFGGSRLSSTVDFNTIEGILNCYCLDNEEARNGLIKFFKENKDITVRAVNFNNSINEVVEIVCDGNELKTKRIR